MEAIVHETPAANPDAFLADVMDGLTQPQKALPCKYFYDEAGSALFDAICQLDEYYPTRTETALLENHGGEMADLIGPGAALIEFGCGSLMKTRLLLDALEEPQLFVPIDISDEHLLRSAEALDEDYPDLEVLPVVGDFTAPLALPEKARNGANRVGFFPGSTIGNFDHTEAAGFLDTIGDMVGPGGALLIGVDLKKDEEILVRAYDDARGVTAAFNLNIIARINRELDGDFRLDAFEHEARYNADEGRIEMHLVSREAQTAHVGGRPVRFQAGESIHTENSYKYDLAEFDALAGRSGFETVETWTDAEDLFSLHYLVQTGG